MAEPEMEKKKTSSSSSSSMTLDSSLLSDSVLKLQLSPSAKKEQTLVNPDWSLLPEELLQLIPTHVENNCCFVSAINARSVCHSWRKTCPFPSRLLRRQSYHVPFHPRFAPSSTLEKIPFFLFRVKTPPMLPSEYFLGGISQADRRTELLPSPIQCSLKANLGGTDPILINMLDCQIIPLGHRYRIIGTETSFGYDCQTNPPAALLPVNREGIGGFVVLLNHYNVLLVLTSSLMDWIQFKRLPSAATCQDLFTFRGKFYLVFLNGDVWVIDPYHLSEVIPLAPLQDLNSTKYLVPSGDEEELFLVEKIIPTPGVLDFGRLACRVSRLDEEAGEWVVVNDLGDRILFIGQLGNVSCLGKELPDGCGLTGNSILFIDEPSHVTYAYRYGVEAGSVEDGSFWRLSTENRVLIRSTSPLMAALRVDCPKPNWSLLPEKLLQLISTHLEKKSCCFFIDAIHARSVCHLWRSAFPLPGLNQSYTLPSFTEFTGGFLPRVTSCTLKKSPLFLFKVQTQTLPESRPPPSEFFLGGIGQEDHHTELSSPFQCSVKADFPGYHPILTNMLDCQILPLGHHYKLMGSYPPDIKRGVAFLPLNKEEDEFVVLLKFLGSLLVLRSSEMRWIRIERFRRYCCKGLHTFRGKFYVIFHNGEIFVIDPYKPMEATPLVTPQDLVLPPNKEIRSIKLDGNGKYLVPSCSDEELFLVEKTISTCRVSKLDEKTGEWIMVSDLGDRAMIIGQLGNFVFSVKEFPDGCGLSRNSILFTHGYDSNVTFAYQYDDLGFWKRSREDRVLIRNGSPPVLALRVDHVHDKCFLW